MKKFETEKELAERLKINVQTLRNYRHLGTGPPYTKIGRCVRYDIEEVDAYLEAFKCLPWSNRR